MKRLICLLSVIAFLSLSTTGWPADPTCTFTSPVKVKDGHKGVEITATCTTGTGVATFPTGAASVLIPNSNVYVGSYLYAVFAPVSLTTAVTNDSDLKLMQYAATGPYDVLIGGGADGLDTSDNSFQPLIGGAPGAMPIYGPLYIDISGNSVNDAEQILVFKFIKPE